MDAERVRSGALSREDLRPGVMGASVGALGVGVKDALMEERLTLGALNPGGLTGIAGLMAEVCVFGGDTSVPPWLGLIMVA